ncbi:hypothetical protein ACF0H5_022858 [Mactra antiquata]
MSDSSSSPPEIIKGTYDHANFYASTNKDDMPKYTGKDTLFTEDATGRVDGHVESSSGEESYSTDYNEKDGSSSPENDGGHFATLESVDTKYMTSSANNIFRNVAQGVNVIEFKDTVHATSYDIPSMPTYFHHQDGELPNPYQVGLQHAYKPIKYETEEDSPSTDRCSYGYSSYGGFNGTADLHRQNESPYGYPVLPPTSTHGTPSPLSQGWDSYNVRDQPLPVYPGKAGVFLCNRELWSKFHTHTTEMIVTKQGRRMFPVLEISLTGLVPGKMYNVYVDMVLSDNHHWKFQSGKWIPVGDAEQLPKTGRVYLHPDSPNTGSHWMKQNIIFNKLKLTNNKSNAGGHIVVNSMHKYQPRINVIEIGPCKTGDPKTLQTHFFPETQFITITQLKIDHNPFAKGFRDTQDGNIQIDDRLYREGFAALQPQGPDFGLHNGNSITNGIGGKSGDDHSVSPTYMKNGVYGVLPESGISACYHPQSYAVPPYNAYGTFSSGGYNIHDGLSAPLSYDQYRFPPQMASSEDQEK